MNGLLPVVAGSRAQQRTCIRPVSRCWCSVHFGRSRVAARTRSLSQACEHTALTKSNGRGRALEQARRLKRGERKSELNPRELRGTRRPRLVLYASLRTCSCQLRF